MFASLESEKSQGNIHVLRNHLQGGEPRGFQKWAIIDSLFHSRNEAKMGEGGRSKMPKSVIT